MSKAMYRDYACGREHILADNPNPNTWMANYYASTEEVLEMLGPPPEDHYDANRRVIEVEISEGKWLDASASSIMKALQTHPDTKHLDPQDMVRIACTMIFRFGQVEKESVEESVASLFTPEEIVLMAREMGKQNPQSSIKSHQSKSVMATDPGTSVKKSDVFTADQSAWTLGGGDSAEVSVEMVDTHVDEPDGEHRGCNGAINPRSWLY